jgi:hypothetical protein
MAVTPNRPAPHADELSEMAIEELDAACGLLWVEMKAITPWGDVYEGVAPSGRAVEIERRYLWSHEPAGAIAVEVEVRDPALRTGAEARAVISPPGAAH